MLELSERFGLRVDPDAYVEDLPVGVQQRVEIIKALLRDASILVLDEPTAVLTPGETEDLFRIMRQLRDSGHSIIFISHKLKEVQAIADDITVIRRGKVVGERPPTTSDAELAALDGRPLGAAAGQQAGRMPGRGRARCARPQRAWRARRPGGAVDLLRRAGRRDPGHRRACKETARPSCARR